MEKIQYQKGKFYDLPIRKITDDGDSSYFQVEANGKEYMIKMFDFQKKDPDVRRLTYLPCMVKDIHGDNIVFVQNFARMFGRDYKEDRAYPFIVQNQGMTQLDGRCFYTVRDVRGVPFKITPPAGVFLMPRQKIYCKVKKMSPDRLYLEYCNETRQRSERCISPDEFFAQSNTSPVMARKIKRLFDRLEIFTEARQLLERGDNEWIIKAILAVPDFKVGGSSTSTPRVKELVNEYIRLCLYMLEESRILLTFPESERANFQDWISTKISNAEIYSEVLDMVESGRLEDEIDSILQKILNSGYVYRPEHKVTILIAIFTIRPHLLEERIDTILDIIKDTDWSRGNTDFRKAFRLFMSYYIESNRDKTNRVALVNDTASNKLLNRMIRVIAYMLLMTEEADIDLSLYRSMLYHYLSYVRQNATIGVRTPGIANAENLIERAFKALMSDDPGEMALNWQFDLTNPEIIAYRMASHPLSTEVLTTKSIESDTTRFTVNNGSIIISPALSGTPDQNILPAGLLPWHNIQIYLPNHHKFNIARNAPLERWKEWWSRVDFELFSKEPKTTVFKKRKIAPEVGERVMLRVLDKDNSDPLRPYRYYCRIEDDSRHGEGWIDIYGVGATVGLFHYNPDFNLGSFYLDGEPLLFEARVNAVVNLDQECPTFMFDAMKLLDDYVKDNCNHGDEVDCKVILHDEVNGVYFAVSEYGYGVFVPELTPGIDYAEGDCIRVSLTDISRLGRIQADVVGPATGEVNIKDAAEALFYSYCDEVTYQESEDQLAREALSVSDEQFEPGQVRQIITILDHKAIMEDEHVKSYGYIFIARILAKMTGDKVAERYLDQRLRMLLILENFGKNGRVDNQEFEILSDGNEDLIESYPLLKEKLCQIKIVDSIGRPENNRYLWELSNRYDSGHLIGKLARLMLSYNISGGMNLDGYRADILERIKQLLNIRIVLPKVYSFGDENQTREFKTSIVFPPEQGMRPNMRVQTFNILKVINGMANAYGGTLYLGVYDTGTAKGLAEDLEHFQGSKDKYKNYLRNMIRVAMGGSFNASITEEFPEAGNHWVYALKIRPVKEPLAMTYDEETYYFLREGCSTYDYDTADRLREAMQNRDFTAYRISDNEIVDDTLPVETAPAPAPALPARSVAHPATVEEHEPAIATGRIRPNITSNWEDGYRADTCCFMRLYDDSTWSLLDDVEWEDGLLTLAIANKERNGSLVLVYPDGEIQSVKMSEILKARAGVRNKMRSDRRPIFVSPATETDALLVVYRDVAGKSLMRLDDVSRFKTSHINDAGTAYPDNGLREIVTCELIPAACHESLKPLHNMFPNTGFFTNHYYGESQRDTLARLGVDLPE